MQLFVNPETRDPQAYADALSHMLLSFAIGAEIRLTQTIHSTASHETSEIVVTLIIRRRECQRLVLRPDLPPEWQHLYDMPGAVVMPATLPASPPIAPTTLPVLKEIHQALLAAMPEADADSMPAKTLARTTRYGRNSHFYEALRYLKAAGLITFINNGYRKLPRAGNQADNLANGDGGQRR